MEIRCINYEQLTKSTPAPPASHQSLACVSAGNWRGPRRHSPLFRCVSVFFCVFFVCAKNVCLQLCNWGFCIEYCVCVSMWKGCVNSWFSLNSALQETQRNAHNLHTQARQKKKKKTTPECTCVNSRFCCYTSRLSDVLMHSKEKPKMLERRRSVKDWNRQRTK